MNPKIEISIQAAKLLGKLSTEVYAAATQICKKVAVTNGCLITEETVRNALRQVLRDQAMRTLGDVHGRAA